MRQRIEKLEKELSTAESALKRKIRKLNKYILRMPTVHAKTVTKSETPMVTDGPFAETREQLLGFFIIDCADAAAAEAAASDLARANASGTGVYELRPLYLLKPGVLP